MAEKIKLRAEVIQAIELLENWGHLKEIILFFDGECIRVSKEGNGMTIETTPQHRHPAS